MLLRHSASYLLARGVPGLVGFAAIVIYTRIMSPESFGQYSLVVSGAMVVNALLFQWLNASLLRFYPQYQDHSGELLSAVLIAYITASFLSGILGTMLMMVFGDSDWGGFILIGVFITWAQAWFFLNLELVRSRLAPVRYGLVSMLKALVALGLGVVLVIMNYGARGALIGLFTGFLVAGIWASWGQWKIYRSKRFNRKLAIDMLSYGLPLAASLAVTVVISSTDRFMLTALIGKSATGLYAASQGLAQQAVGVLMTMVNLAAYPLILRTHEHSGRGETCIQLRKNAILLLIVGLPVTTVFIVLSPNIAAVFLGNEFRLIGEDLMPLFALATLLAGARGYYYDLAFYLGKRTNILMMVIGISAFLNVALNYWLIPKHGVLGAVYASVVTHGIALLFSAFLGRKIYPLPEMSSDYFRLILATIAMALALLIVPKSENTLGLISSVAVGGAVYLIVILILNPGGVRQVAARIYTQNLLNLKIF